jgi:hypothetical protein
MTGDSLSALGNARVRFKLKVKVCDVLWTSEHRKSKGLENCVGVYIISNYAHTYQTYFEIIFT